MNQGSDSRRYPQIQNACIFGLCPRRHSTFHATPQRIPHSLEKKRSNSERATRTYEILLPAAIIKRTELRQFHESTAAENAPRIIELPFPREISVPLRNTLAYNLTLLQHIVEGYKVSSGEAPRRVLIAGRRRRRKCIRMGPSPGCRAFPCEPRIYLLVDQA